MKIHRITFVAVLLAFSVLAGVGPSTAARGASPSRVELPVRLSDAEFWQLSEAYSEPGGTFHSDNFVSNEGRFQSVIPDLVKRSKPGGLYVGVGPEQNFTYISALRPRMAFIIDIRRGNLHEHLLYKALMEMSVDRAEFLSRLFSRARPAGLGPASTPEQLFAAFDGVRPTDARYQANLKAVTEWLTKKHGFALHPEDPEGIAYVYRTAFYADGPALGYQLTGQGGGGGRGGGNPTYAQLMTMDDGAGRQRSYLATEQNFAFLKDLEARNLIVPVVGDFGGTKALRSIARYARTAGATVSAFYLSNVEQYLTAAGSDAFCATVATMPLDGASTFIRSVRGGGGGGGGRGPGGAGGTGMFTSSLGDMQAETRGCAVPASGGRGTAGR